MIVGDPLTTIQDVEKTKEVSERTKFNVILISTFMLNELKLNEIQLLVDEMAEYKIKGFVKVVTSSNLKDGLSIMLVGRHLF